MRDLTHRVATRWLQAAPRKQPIEITTSRGPRTVEALVVGSWAVHKQLEGRDWKVTHVPSGLATLTFRAQRDAVGVLAEIAKEPDLLGAKSVPEVMRFKDLILGLQQQVLTGRPHAVPGTRKPVIDIEGILLDAGLHNQGKRHGKAGEFWGVRGSSRMIAVGAREVLQNVFFVGAPRYGQFDTRWLMKDSVLKTKMTEPVLRAWAAWARKGLSTKELYEKARTQGSVDGGMFSR